MTAVISILETVTCVIDNTDASWNLSLELIVLGENSS